MNASRTLLKSPPELWSECSDAASLAKHLGAFGEIRITKLEPEIAVAWEGTAARGTVRLEPSGWGTRVVLTAEPTSESTGTVQESAPVVPEPMAETEDSDPEAVAPEAVAIVAAGRPSLFARLLSLLPLRSAEPEPEPEPDTKDEPNTELVAEEPPSSSAQEPAPPASPGAEDALNDALDSLGRAHHRPYSRA
jgi:hypothetical protein